ncbi:multiple epidermal growth factor-like domains 10 [Elysia marginata]|uniref:Multiple epidermal growth factor-like domains 10 n=1 Tax=Elysia marginata TaxID=1093978 RepID=A0AAV4JKZ8_9GAST|nr:multiple epidermal growth factor-like domains 10 [Elysia marginata]
MVAFGAIGTSILPFKGRNCSQVCREDDADPACPTQTCHCLGTDQRDCGPDLPLCKQGCQKGWMGISCSLPCPIGFYGYNCQEKCGNCLYDKPNVKNGTKTCIPTNGTCSLGCADRADKLPTCGSPRTSAQLYEQPSDSHRTARYKKLIQACQPLTYNSLLEYDFLGNGSMVAQRKRINEKRVQMMVRRAMNPKVDDKIKDEHQQFHEAYVKRDIMKKLNDQPQDLSKAHAKAKAEAIRLMILEMENHRRQNRAAVPDEEGEDDEQDPDQKVAFWILAQNFLELIDRRKKRLRDYRGDVLNIIESPYKISEVSEISDIHKLYDDLEHLGIP